MVDVISNVDLEDGEIESDGEAAGVQNEEDKREKALIDETHNGEPSEIQDYRISKSGKKKKSKSYKGEQKYKDKSKKHRKYDSPTPEDDFAGNIEKAIRKAMNKSDDADGQPDDEAEDRRRHKKRRKNDGKDGPHKKRRKHDYMDEMDESEMMCVRGASPVQKSSTTETYQSDGRDSYESDSSQDPRRDQHHRSRHRTSQRERNKNKSDRRRGTHPMQDPEGVCLYFMQGKCHKGEDCIYSHDAQPPRKMELCKFYLMDCCAKRDKCLYMHSDFPCKYYHTGLPCIYKDDCKFAHGKPLNETLKNILLKHIESAPKEILGDFPRLNREGALKMIQTTQSKLIQQYPDCAQNQEKIIPSLFDINIPNPMNNMDSFNNQFNNDRPNKSSPKVRQSRWQSDGTNQNFNMNMSPVLNSVAANVLSIKNLTGVLTPRQISDLNKMGIDNLDKLGQLTVLQLNSIGISLKQITDIQLNTMSIQKLGLINSNNEQNQTAINTGICIKDLDLRVAPALPMPNNLGASSALPGYDVDMRFQQNLTVQSNEETDAANKLLRPDMPANKDMIDIDQYTKDALKFVSKDKDNFDNSNNTYDIEKTVTLEPKDVDHRVLPFTEGDARNSTLNMEDPLKSERDTDIRFLQPESMFKNSEKINHLSTTDDEDNNLLIDEKWYSSDEEKGPTKQSPHSSPKPATIDNPEPLPHVIEPSTVLSKIGDLSKIDISEEVTKLLNTMKNNLHEKTETITGETSTQKNKDPRCKRSPDISCEPNKQSSTKQPRVSIYECIEGEPTDGRRRTDVDLRQNDFSIPNFGDTDLRHISTGDIDFRLGLPFKPIPNYTPASEIDGSINSHPPIIFKLLPIDIPRPDYTDIKNSTAKSQALLDPRLRKVFRLSIEDSSSDTEKPSTATTSNAPRIDPRRKPKDINEELKPKSLDLQSILQNSNWYKDLSTTQKIFVNQNLAPVTQQIKQHQQDKTPGKKFDLSSVHSNTVLCSIFTNLGVTLNDNGEYSYLPKPKEALLKTPIINPNTNPFNNLSPGNMDVGSLNMMNMPPMNMGVMNNMNVRPMHGYNQSFPDLRGGPAPGLLGIAPNIPHNFNSNVFNGPNNYNNMPYNGPGPAHDFGYMESEQGYHRFPNRGGHRGRGNDRWNRGGSSRGQNHRKMYVDRNNWKNNRD